MSADTFMMEIDTAMAGVSNEQLAQSLGFLFGMIGIILAFAAVIMLVEVICRWRIFSKAGDKGWKALIPLYATYTEFALTWSGIYGIVMMVAVTVGYYLTANFSPESFLFVVGGFVSLAGSILSLIQMHKLSRSFGHGFGFTLGLLFLNPIFLLILAFGKSEYVGPCK